MMVMIGPHGEDEERNKQDGDMEGLGVGFEETKRDEARRAWEMGKRLDLSSSNETDVIWAMAKSRNPKI